MTSCGEMDLTSARTALVFAPPPVPPAAVPAFCPVVWGLVRFGCSEPFEGELARILYPRLAGAKCRSLPARAGSGSWNRSWK